LKKYSLILFLILIPLHYAPAQDSSLGRTLDSFIKIWSDLKDQVSTYSEISDEDEMNYGSKIADVYDSSANLSDYKLTTVESIGQNLSKSVSRTKIVYKFRVINDTAVNAFSIAGGNVYITTGLLDFVQSDDELAFVIGHEMGHVDRKHAMHQIEYSVIAEKIGGSDAGSVSSIIYNLMNTPFTKYQEFEADEAGVTFAGATGYDPLASLDFFDRLTAITDKKRNENNIVYQIIKSHPYSYDRKQHLKDYIKNNLDK